MVRLSRHNSVSQWKHEQVLRYPEIKLFIEKLETMVKDNPDKGLFDPILSETGEIWTCRKQSVNITLFSHWYAIGYSYIIAHYIYNETDVYIIRMSFN